MEEKKVTVETETLTIEKSSLNKRLKEPIVMQVLKTNDKVALDIQRYLIESLSSRCPKLIPLALNNQSIQRLAEYFKYERSASRNSPSQYIYTINRYCVWANMQPDDLIAECKDPEGLMNLKALPKAAQRLDRYYKELMVGDYAPHSVAEWIAQIKSFYKTNNVDIPFARKLQGRTVSRDRAPKPEELQRVIDIAADLREKVIVSMLALGGFREGTLAALKYKHAKADLENGIVPLHIHVEAEITKGKYHDYDTFIGREAVEYLKAYLDLRRRGSPDGKIPPETITDESPLIRNKHIRYVKPIVPRHIYKCVHGLYYRAGLLTEKTHRRFNIRVHSIRKFFRTQLSALGVDRDYVEYMMGHTIGTYHDIEMKGIEFLRNIYAASGLSIRPKTQLSKIEALKEIVRAWGMNPEEVLTRETLSRPYATYVQPASYEEEQVKSLSQALKDMMRKELLNSNDNP
jgi:site-specific recombinase XerD